MSRKKTRRAGILFLFLLLCLIGVTILWVGVPLLAGYFFDSPGYSLNSFARWKYSLQVLIGRADLVIPVSTIPGEVEFEIQPEETVNRIAERLEAAGLIADRKDFRAYLIYKGLDSTIKAGKFILSPSMTGIEIAKAIQSTYTATVPFYIYPGWRAEEIAAALPSSGIEVRPEDFLRLVHSPLLLTTSAIVRDFPSADGFLFPGIYEIDRKISAEDLLLLFVHRFEESVPSNIRAAIEAQGLTLYEGITLASIIQRETFADEERARIASVFYNRLAKGMKLETDPTVQYSLGYSEIWGGWWKTPLSVSDLGIDSAYNTYQIYGLPPTPISNPDLPSIQAVAYPEQTDYYYFRAKCDGSGLHDFSRTFEEHLSKACE